MAAGQWYTDAVIWAAANDIVNGIGDNQFGPENTLTREQLVTMLYRYAQNKGYDVTASADLSGYPDAGQIQSWAQEAMTWAVAEGIVEGMDGNLNPPAMLPAPRSPPSSCASARAWPSKFHPPA